jgi:hypothetical protein
MLGTDTLETSHQRLSSQLTIALCVILLSVLCLSTAAWAKVPEPYAIEPVQLQASSKLSKALADALDPQGSVLYTMENGVRMDVCEIFWAKTVAEQDVPAKSSSLVYGNLKPGALVGMVHFLPGADEEYRKDNKDQKLKPGYYTMRYGILQSGIGAHGPEQGDFVLLSPAALDHDPGRVIPATELIRLSHVASRTKEPAVMNLIEVTAARKEFPGVTTDYAGTCVMQVKLRVKPKKSGESQDLALAIVIMTPLVEGEGS